jgi:starch synthase
MSKKRVLFVTQEMKPYTVITEVSDLIKKLPIHTHEKGMEVRILMPKYGSINERRHRLHEVVRLSGMNIIVDDEDFPLIIKVASLPGARLQVYFLDNDEFFKRKFVFDDIDEKPFADNEDRMVFFCKSVMETVKKFGWPPDIIHCHGWMTSLVPLYLKKVYKDDPVFQKSKLVYSPYVNDYQKLFTERFFDIACINNLTKEDLADFGTADNFTLDEGGVRNSDAVIRGSENIADNVKKAIDTLKLPSQEFLEEDEMLKASVEMYKSLMEE